MLNHRPQLDIQTPAGELFADPEGLPQLWGWQGFWQIRLRWAVAPLVVVSVLIGRLLGCEFAYLPILVVAFASPIYNAVLRVCSVATRSVLQPSPSSTGCSP